MGRSVAGVVGGILYLIAGIMAINVILTLSLPEASLAATEGHSAHHPWLLPLFVSFCSLVGVLGGYMGAYIAARAEVVHALAIAIFALIGLGASTFIAQAGQVPLWYQLALPLGVVLGVLLGGALRAVQVGRRPPGS